MAWHGPALMQNPDEWVRVFTDAEIAELDDALALAASKTLDVIELDADNFPLPTLAPRLAALRDELVEGRGIILMRGLPVHRYSSWQVCAAFYGMGAYLGWTCPQNAKGHVLGHVKDLGNDPNDPATRFYTTCAAQPFHTDSADIVVRGNGKRDELGYTAFLFSFIPSQTARDPTLLTHSPPSRPPPPKINKYCSRECRFHLSQTTVCEFAVAVPVRRGSAVHQQQRRGGRKSGGVVGGHLERAGAHLTPPRRGADSAVSGGSQRRGAAREKTHV